MDNSFNTGYLDISYTTTTTPPVDTCCYHNAVNHYASKTRARRPHVSMSSEQNHSTDSSIQQWLWQPWRLTKLPFFWGGWLITLNNAVSWMPYFAPPPVQFQMSRPQKSGKSLLNRPVTKKETTTDQQESFKKSVKTVRFQNIPSRSHVVKSCSAAYSSESNNCLQVCVCLPVSRAGGGVYMDTPR